jgi:dTDP-4-dehydrorhamnose reductase
VFDGRRGNYDETDEVNPLTRYGETKAVRKKSCWKIRVTSSCALPSTAAFPLPATARSMNNCDVALQASGQGMTLFTDEFRCPIPAVETARAVWELAQKNCAGLYHVAGAEKLSRWQIGQLLSALAGSRNKKFSPARPGISPARRALWTRRSTLRKSRKYRTRCPA